MISRKNNEILCCALKIFCTNIQKSITLVEKSEESHHPAKTINFLKGFILTTWGDIRRASFEPGRRRGWENI
jgi:hypothetical protein